MNPEWIENAKATKSAEELLELAKANDVELTAEEANTYFAQLNSQIGEISDDELGNVSGGGCGDPPEPPKFQVGDHVLKRREVVCNLQFPYTCRSSYYVVDRIVHYDSHGYQYIVHCPVCHASVGLWESEVVKL